MVEYYQYKCNNICICFIELANNYKEDGNFNFKYKNYRLGILSYTEGIRTKCKDIDLMAQLYNNRAAAHFMLKNYRYI